MNETDAVVGLAGMFVLAYLSHKPWFRRMVVDVAKASKKESPGKVRLL